MKTSRMTRPTRSPGASRSPGVGEVASAVGTLATSVSDAVEEFLESVSPAPRPRHHHDPCPSCRPADCHCTCCVSDADLVVYTRLFERRIVPVRIENVRRRERRITLELSRFTTKGGRPAPVRGRIVGPSTFTLPGCGDREVALALSTGTEKFTAEVAETAETIEVDRELLDRVERGEEEVDRLPDVDDCLVAVADLRIEGCDVRPVRIAVPILPRDCAAYEILCDCACCG